MKKMKDTIKNDTSYSSGDGLKHTCHISHCEIKSHRNFAHVEANSHKIIKSHRIFRPSYNTFYEEVNINHTYLFLSQASYI